MSVLDLIQARQSCRAYTDSPVSSALIEKMLESARLAPSACNQQPWRFAVATLLGLLPVSFALAHFGAEIGNGDYRTLVSIVLVIGMLTIAPILYRVFKKE